MTATLTRWSARPCTGPDRDAALALFAEPGFHFRTDHPGTAAEWELLALLDADVRLLVVGDEPVGLFALEGEGSDHGCHYRLHLRLRSCLPTSWWVEAYQEVVRAVRWRRDVVRLSWRFAEFDHTGIAAARAAGLTEEGTMAEIVLHEGRRHGRVFFAQIWTP